MKMVWVLCPLLLMVPMLCAGTSHMLQHVQRIVFFGDSLTDGADWPDWAVNTLRAETPARHLELYNAGVGGNTYHDLRVRLATDVLALHPDLVVLHSGTNDIFQKVTDAAYRADLEAILHTLRDRHIRVLLLTTPPVKDPVVCARQHELNAIVCEVAAHFKCPVADAHDAFDKAIAAGVEPLGPDGVHHTAAGWRLMGQTVLLALGGKLPLQETVAPARIAGEMRYLTNVRLDGSVCDVLERMYGMLEDMVTR